MKLAILSVVVSVGVMGVLAFQAFRQELYLHGLRAHITETSIVVTKKEEAIVEMKNKIQTVKRQLQDVNKNLDELKKKKASVESERRTFEASLQRCNAEKGNAEKMKTEVSESFAKYQADHEVAKQKAQEDIQSLKEQILRRDQAICAFVDTSNAEARRLCANPNAEK